VALLGAANHATPYPSRNAKTGHHETNRLARISPYLFTLLRSTGAELKIMQELLRHSTIRVTLDTYTQAVTTEKRNAQEAVVSLLFPEKAQST
jgi:site-specific recombinase XerD